MSTPSNSLNILDAFDHSNGLYQDGEAITADRASTMPVKLKQELKDLYNDYKSHDHDDRYYTKSQTNQEIQDAIDAIDDAECNCPDATTSVRGLVKNGTAAQLNDGTETECKAWSAKDLKDFSEASGIGSSGTLATGSGQLDYYNDRTFTLPSELTTGSSVSLNPYSSTTYNSYNTNDTSNARLFMYLPAGDYTLEAIGDHNAVAKAYIDGSQIVSWELQGMNSALIQSTTFTLTEGKILGLLADRVVTGGDNCDCGIGVKAS